ncbi:MAG: hypothetical protein JO264_16450 [Acidisphaera sp.]|nr:hypothetical protein [Acidisphaera sp.]
MPLLNSANTASGTKTAMEFAESANSPLTSSKPVSTSRSASTASEDGSGLGSLTDADPARESAQLQSLQIKQQLGTQALSIVNEAPSSLVSLLKNP